MVSRYARHAIRVSPDALRQIRSGHPWVYDRSIRSGPVDASPGDLGVVFDGKRRFAAIGLWDPNSPIRLRILHTGRPLSIDEGFWAGRISQAVARRRPLYEADSTESPPRNGPSTGWRVVHGENDGLPGLVADRYESVLVIRLDTAALDAHLDQLVDHLVDALDAVGVEVDTVVVRTSRRVGRQPQLHRGRRPSGPIRFLENGLSLTADVWEGQKTGHFLDQRDNRRLIGGIASGTAVLDVFACTGGFSAHAAAGGAATVVSVDQSRWALAAAERHVAANRAHADCRHRTVAGDAFEVLDELAATGRRFDVVVVDPPSFAARAAHRERALGAYRRLAAAAAQLTEPGGHLLQASCSSRVEADAFVDSVSSGITASGRSGTVVERTGHALDHPVGFAEGAYLKAVLTRID